MKRNKNCDDENLSLISYQESEKADEKYYNEQELIDIIGTQIKNADLKKGKF